jgi:arylsulfatase
MRRSPRGDDTPSELKPILTHHVGRLVDTLEEHGILDDTLICYIIGDNGASAGGALCKAASTR